jgi:predicted ATPase/DNA-binding CsgD family transcriptional regulator
VVGRRIHGLPAPPTRLIGRAQDVAAARRQLLREDVRLVTFTGPGGTGKTRLALEVAASLGGSFEQGVFFVDLAPIDDANLVATSIAHVFEARPVAEEPLADRLKQLLASKHVLLVLDNFEHVLGAAPLVAELLAACHALKVLVTSREPLRLRWEHAFPVQPLPVPDWRRHQPLDRLEAVPSVALFVERARAVKPDFVLNAANAEAVAQLCVRLDGLPLALELAASRARMFQPQAMLTQLSRPLDLLTGGGPDYPLRQQTIRQAVAWSYHLLDPAEQALFRLLSVFSAGCTMEAALAVAGSAGAPTRNGPLSTESEMGQENGPASTLTNLESLLAKSLLRQETGQDGEFRFTMLETIRQYAAEQRISRGEEKSARWRHASYFLTFAERAEPHLHGPHQQEWFERMAAEHDNLHAALQWLIEQRHEESACQMGAALWPFWQVRGFWSEGRELLASLLALPAAPQTVWRAKVLFGAGALAWAQSDNASASASYTASLEVWRKLGDLPGVARTLNALGLVVRRQDRQAARILYEESLAIAQRTGDPRLTADALNSLGIIDSYQADFTAARDLFERSLALRRTLNDRRDIANSLLNLGNVLTGQQDYPAAQGLFEESLRIFRQLGSKLGIVSAALNLGTLAHARNDFATARSLFEESLALQREMNNRPGIARSLSMLARTVHAQGDHGTARQLFVEGLDLWHELPGSEGIGECLTGLAAIAVSQGKAEPALQLAGAAARLREGSAAHDDPTNPRPRLQHDLETARRLLDERAAASAWAKGQAMSLEEAVEYARTVEIAAPLLPQESNSVLRGPTREASGSLHTPGALTSREREVAILIARGYTNKRIGAELVITTGTAAIHVEHIRKKLRFRSRTQIATWATAQGWLTSD